MTKKFKWNEPAEPMKVAGRSILSGTKGLSVWLITTSEGHILLNNCYAGLRANDRSGDTQARVAISTATNWTTVVARKWAENVIGSPRKKEISR